MKKFRVELAGTVTRDIIWKYWDAENQDDASKSIQLVYPSYKVTFIEELEDNQ